MLFYYGIYISLILLSLIKEKKLSFCLYSYSILFFFFLSFLRWEIGGDWDTYRTMFLNSKNHIYPFVEKGFGFLNFFVRKYTSSYTICLLFESIIIFTCLHKAIWKLSIMPMMSLACFFALFRGYIYYVRQDIAICLCISSIYYFIENKRIFSMILFCLSFLFHSASVIFIFAFFFVNKRLSYKFIIITLVSSIVFPVFINLFLKSLAGIGFSLFTRGLHYLENGDELYGYGNGLTKTFMLFRSGASRILLFIIFYFCRKKNKDDGMYNILFNLYFLSFCIFFAFTPISFTLGRFVNFYSFSEYLLFPYLLKLGRYKFEKILILFFLYIYLALRIYSGLSSYLDLVVPFKIINLLGV